MSRSRTPRIVLFLSCAVASVLSLPLVTAQAATQSFTYTGGEQVFSVPAGVTSLHVVAIGARGGADGAGDAAGGFGSVLTADLSVTAGEILYIEVGGSGKNGGGSYAQGGTGGQGGFNGGGAGGNGLPGGGGGGGASDVRTAPLGSSGSLGSRLLVAAGAGGGAGGNGAPPGEAGGNGGAAGESSANASGGGAGTAGGGGAGGTSNFSGGTGGDGTLGQGGASVNCGPCSGGGGGGGGLYGGGAGGLSNTNGSGGGGGGSNTFGARASNVSIVGDTSGTPTITISYQAPSGGPPPSQPPPPKAPGVSAVSLTHSRFRVSPATTAISAKAPLGTRFLFTLSAAAKVTIAITHRVPGLRSGRSCVAPTAKLRRKHAKRCTRTLTAGMLTRSTVPAGAGGVDFSGRIGRRPLTPGKYKALLSASNLGGQSQPVTLSFTVVP